MYLIGGVDSEGNTVQVRVAHDALKAGGVIRLSGGAQNLGETTTAVNSKHVT